MNRTAHQARAWLRASGFPEALLPREVTAFEYDEDTGHFRLHLARELHLHAVGDVVAFATTVTGVLEPLRIVGLDGVAVVAEVPRRVFGMSTDERRTTVTFDLCGGRVSVPYESLC